MIILGSGVGVPRALTVSNRACVILYIAFGGEEESMLSAGVRSLFPGAIPISACKEIMLDVSRGPMLLRKVDIAWKADYEMKTSYQVHCARERTGGLVFIELNEVFIFNRFHQNHS